MRGYVRRNETKRQLLAWHAANVMAPHIKKRDRPSPKDLLGKQSAKPKDRFPRRRYKKRKTAEEA